ncbi:MAG: hypothetical protein ACYSU0_18480 [Planctomycetota bacterium]|jgi:hypothetical protein
MTAAWAERRAAHPKDVRGMVKKLMPVAVLLSLTSCATTPDMPVFQMTDPRLYEELVAEVSKGGWRVRDSLPELRYARGPPSIFETTYTITLHSAEGQAFQILVLDCPGTGFPDYDFMLIYLRDPEGNITDWRSRWLYNRRGNLKTRMLDVNDNGSKEFCFVCKPFGRPEVLLAAYRVRGGEFEAVIAEEESRFTIGFRETVAPNGIVIRPQLQGRCGWQTGKLYEVPLRVTNGSDKAIDIGGCYVGFSPDGFYGAWFARSLSKDRLGPGEAVETTVTLRFCRGLPEREYGFEIERATIRP